MRPTNSAGMRREHSRTTLPFWSSRASWWWSGCLTSHMTRPCQSTSSTAPPLMRGRLESVEVLHDFAAVQQVPVVEQVAVESGSVREAPHVCDVAIHLHEIHGAVTEHRRKKRIAGLRARGVVGDESSPRSPDFLLIH